MPQNIITTGLVTGLHLIFETLGSRDSSIEVKFGVIFSISSQFNLSKILLDLV